MKNGWKKICRCRKGQMLKGIVLTLTLAFLTMGLCGCAEKHDAAEEIEEFTLEGESDVGKKFPKFQNRVRKRNLRVAQMQKKDCRRHYMFMYVEL